MRWSVILLLGAALAHAENSDTNGKDGTASRGLHGGVSVFDDRVFNVGNSAPQERSRRSMSGSERYLDDEPNYHSGQRNRWMDICEPEKAMGMRAYQACYDSERRRETGSGRRYRPDSEPVPGRISGEPNFPRFRSAPRGESPDFPGRGRDPDPAYDFRIQRSYENY